MHGRFLKMAAGLISAANMDFLRHTICSSSFQALPISYSNPKYSPNVELSTAIVRGKGIANFLRITRRVKLSISSLIYVPTLTYESQALSSNWKKEIPAAKISFLYCVAGLGHSSLTLLDCPIVPTRALFHFPQSRIVPFISTSGRWCASKGDG